MPSLILRGYENQFSWQITGLSGAFNQSAYIQAGITIYQFTVGGTTSISGVIDSVSAPYSGSSTSTTTRYVSYEPGTYTFWAFTQVQDGRYWPAGSATVTITGRTEYTAIIEFDANGGRGAPSSITVTDDSSPVSVTLPYTEPTRSGYVFTGWSTNRYAEYAEYSPGGRYQFYANETGYLWTLYAVWTQEAGGARIYSGGWGKYSAYIYTGSGWRRATPYIYDGRAWRKCM